MKNNNNDNKTSTLKIGDIIVHESDLTVGKINGSYDQLVTYSGDLNMSIITDSSGVVAISNDPYAQLEAFTQEKEMDEKLRDEHPDLQEAYEHYQLIKKLVEDQEIDKTFDERYKGFRQE